MVSKAHYEVESTFRGSVFVLGNRVRSGFIELDYLSSSISKRLLSIEFDKYRSSTITTRVRKVIEHK